MLNDLEALEVFASLCTTGSIQKTAQALGIDSPTASRKLTKLETQLGRQLINREKRPFEMTADACAIIGSVKKILEERQQIETYYPKSRSKPSRYSSENDVLIEKSVKYTDFFLLSIVYV